jgi:hypothetical protein
MPALRELDLSTNGIGDAGFTDFVAHFRRGNADDAPDVTLALETVNLQDNNITADTACLLLPLLTNITPQQPSPLACPRLAAIYMDDNPVVRSPQGRECLEHMKAVTGIAWAYAEIW